MTAHSRLTFLATLLLLLVLGVSEVQAYDDLGEDEEYGSERSSSGFTIGFTGKFIFDSLSIKADEGNLELPQSIVPVGELSLRYFTPSFATRVRFSIGHYNYGGLNGFTPTESTGLRLTGEWTSWVRPWHDSSAWPSKLEFGAGIFFYHRSFEETAPYSLLGTFLEAGFGLGARYTIPIHSILLEPEFLAVLPGYFSGTAAEFGALTSSIHLESSIKILWVISQRFKLGSGFQFSWGTISYGRAGSRTLTNASDNRVSMALPLHLEVSF